MAHHHELDPLVKRLDSCVVVKAKDTGKVQNSSKTLWHMIMYFQTKFGSKRISNSENIVKTVIF